MREASDPAKLWGGGGLDAGSALSGPPRNPAFVQALDELVAVAGAGQRTDSDFYNPSDEWLKRHLRIFQDLPPAERDEILREAAVIAEQVREANAAGKAAARAWPDIAVRLDSGGVGFFSQLGVARRPDLIHYFVDAFPRDRDALSFSEENQALFAEVFPYIIRSMRDHFASGDFDLNDIPPPTNERELAWLLSFCWHLDQAYNTLGDVAAHRAEGTPPSPETLRGLHRKYEAGLARGLALPPGGADLLAMLGLAERAVPASS